MAKSRVEISAAGVWLIGGQETSVGHSVSHAQPGFVLTLRHAHGSDRPWEKLWGNRPPRRAGAVVSWG